jgi:uncharacterized protein YndB with AHSA1/START domain
VPLTADETREVVVERVLPASPRAVFHEWTDAESFAEWMCPRPARATRVELDARVGGSLRIDVADGSTEFVVTGEYVEVDPPHRLAFTWRCSNWPEPRLYTVVTVTIEPHGVDQSLMRIRHRRLPPMLVSQHEEGWARIAEQLELVLPRPA